MKLQLVIVDAFTDRPFSGNPAAVAVVEQFPDREIMQLVAREMNLSETAFVVRRDDGEYDLRWFTPGVEVDLCGHATLAASHVVGPSSFHTKSGRLSCTTAPDGRIAMDFPADPPSAITPPEWFELEGTVSLAKGRVGTLIEFDTAARVRTFAPDSAFLMRLDGHQNIVTAEGDRDGIDVVSRVFCPGIGIPEDPVTGSAHCLLGEFWGERLQRTFLTAEQASARGGIVGIERNGDRVTLLGRAVAVGRVELSF